MRVFFTFASSLCESHRRRRRARFAAMFFTGLDCFRFARLFVLLVTDVIFL